MITNKEDELKNNLIASETECFFSIKNGTWNVVFIIYTIYGRNSIDCNVDGVY